MRISGAEGEELVIHSMDPCLACSVHVARPADRGGVILLSGPTLGPRLAASRVP